MAALRVATARDVNASIAAKAWRVRAVEQGSDAPFAQHGFRVGPAHATREVQLGGNCPACPADVPEP